MWQETWNRIASWRPAGAGAASETRHPRAGSAAGTRAIVLLALLLALLGGSASYARSTMFPPVVYKYYGYGADERSGPRTTNLLFDSDSPMRVVQASDRFAAEHSYSAEHPLLSLALFPPVKLLTMAGLEPVEALRALLALHSALWTFLLFFLLAQWGCRLFDAAVFTVLANVSAASIFWLSVPESFVLGSATMLAALLLSFYPQRVAPVVRYSAGMALSLSITVTNAMVGLIAAARRLSVRQLWIAGVSAWFVVTMLWVAEKYLFPETVFFMPPRGDWVSKYSFALTLDRVVEVLRTFLFHGTIMPQIEILSGAQLPRPDSAERMLSVQHDAVGEVGWLGMVGLVGWSALLALGAWSAWASRSNMALLCALILAGQFVLHIVFGEETFLYTLHVQPLLVILAAEVTFTRWRLFGLALASVVSVCAGINNYEQFEFAVQAARDLDDFARAYTPAP